MRAARYLRDAVLFACCYVLLDWASYIEPLGPFNITPWNPGPAVAVVWMVFGGLTNGAAVFAALLLTDAIIRDLPGGYPVSLLSAATLTFGYGSIAAALRRLLPLRPKLATVRDVTRLVSAVVPGTALIGAAFLGGLVIAGSLPREVLPAGWLRFWIGDVVGILVTAPLLFVVADVDARKTLLALAKRPEMHALAALIVLTLWLVLHGPGPDPSRRFFLLFPVVVWIALRGGLAGTVAAIVTIQLAVVIAFHYSTAHPLPILELQAFMATLTLTGLYLGVVVDERQRATDRLKQSLRLVAAGEMAGAITHEVSQPLTALASYSRSARLLVEARIGDAELLEIIEKISSESLRAAEVVRRLREFFRAGAMRLQAIAAAELLELVNRVGAQLTAQTDVSFSAQSEPGLPPVHADSLQIEVILRNLISNAIESVQQHDRPEREVALRMKRDGVERITITVSDSGPGVTAAAAKGLFDPFVSGKPGGMGLGLVVSRAIAEAHGGSLDVVPKDHGEFRLLLPLGAGRG